MLQKTNFPLIYWQKKCLKASKAHVSCIFVRIWGRNNSHISRDIYISHSAVSYGSGEAVVNYFLHNLETFAFPWPYPREYLIGKAMDGQYTFLNVDKHKHEKLQLNKIQILTWAGTQYIGLKLDLKIQSQLSVFCLLSVACCHLIQSRVNLIHRKLCPCSK